MANVECPVCKNKNTTAAINSFGKDISIYHCKQCGDFEITETARVMISSQSANPRLSFALRKLYNDGEKNLITSTNTDEIIKKVEYPEKLGDKVDALIIYLYKHPEISSSGFHLSKDNIFSFGIENASTMRIIRDYIEDKKLFKVDPKLVDGSGIIFLKANGFDRAEELLGLDTVSEDDMTQSITKNNVCFLVHGHDDKIKNEVARFIEKELNIDVIILHEKPSKSRTIIEKIEANSEVDFTVCLYTGDDFGCKKMKDIEIKDLSERARQNVIFEAGYFMGKLGREKVFILIQDNVENPTDTGGIIYISLNGEWKEELRREVKEIYSED